MKKETLERVESTTKILAILFAWSCWIYGWFTGRYWLIPVGLIPYFIHNSIRWEGPVDLSESSYVTRRILVAQLVLRLLEDESGQGDFGSEIDGIDPSLWTCSDPSLRAFLRLADDYFAALDEPAAYEGILEVGSTRNLLVSAAKEMRGGAPLKNPELLEPVRLTNDGNG